MTKKFLPILKRRRKQSGMIVVSSVAAISPTVNGITYSATKVFGRYLFKALNDESLVYMSRVELLNLMPSLVETNLTERVVKNKWLRKALCFITPPECVSGCLRDIGTEE